jgi:hypothetical protein
MENPNKVLFSREQYEYLNKTFPEVIGTSNTTHAEFLNYSGKRSVVEFIKARMK